MKDTIGVTGIESLKLGGMSVDELPIAEAAITKEQLPQFLKSVKDNEIEAIKGKYPKQTLAWVDGAIRECEGNLSNMRRLITEQSDIINNYSAQISLCEHRDKLLKDLDPEKDKDRIKELNIQFPPYNVDAMRQQIKQCKEAIVRSNDVIDQEHESIARLKSLRVKCEQRDNELRAYGVTV